MKFYLESYFPPQFRFLGVIGLVISAVLFVTGPAWVTVFLVPISLALLFTFGGVRIDSSKMCIKVFTSVVGLEFGKCKPYNTLQKITIKPVKYSQTMNSRGSSSTLHYTQYNAYLIADNESFLLKGDKNQLRITKKMETIANNLSTPLNVE